MKPYLQMGNAYQTTGVQRTLYQNVDYNIMNWPQNSLTQALANGSLAGAIPNPLSGYRLLEPDGSVTAPAVSWAALVDQGTGRYRIGTNDVGEAVNGALKFDWTASRLKLASGFSLDITDMTLGSVLFAGSGGRVSQDNTNFFWDASGLSLKLGDGTYLQMGTKHPVFPNTVHEIQSLSYSFNGPVRVALQNTNAGSSAHSTISTLSDEGNDSSFGIANSGWSGGTVAAGESFWIMNTGAGSGPGGRGMYLLNALNSYIRFGSNSTERARLLSTGEWGFNTTTARRQVDVLSTSGPQLRLTYTDNSVYTDLQTSSLGNLTITPTGGGIYFKAVSPWADVKAYGAVGDGTTNDAAAIALAVAAVNTAGGGVVYFPKGNYKITSTISVPDVNIRFVGAGRDVTIITPSGAIAAFTYSHASAAFAFIEWQDMVVQGDATVGQRAFYLDDSNFNIAFGWHRCDAYNFEYCAYDNQGDGGTFVDCNWQVADIATGTHFKSSGATNGPFLFLTTCSWLTSNGLNKRGGIDGTAFVDATNCRFDVGTTMVLGQVKATACRFAANGATNKTVTAGDSRGITITGSEFRGGAFLSIVTGLTTAGPAVVAGCFFRDTPTRCIDIASSITKCAVSGNSFTYTSEALRTAGSGLTCSGNESCKVLESAGADTNTYIGIDDSSTLVGTSSVKMNPYASTSSTTPQVILDQASTGDCSIRQTLGTGNSYAFGIDNSDSDSWKLSYNAAGAAVLGTSDFLTVTTGGRLGINTTGPDARVDSLDTSLAQYRATYTDGSVYTDFQTTSAGILNITPTGNAVNVICADGSNAITITPGAGGLANTGYLQVNARARFGYDGTAVAIDSTAGGAKPIYLKTTGTVIRHAIGGNGQTVDFQIATELTTIAAAATTDTAIQIPLDAVVLSVSVRVTVVIPTAATFTVTGTTSGTQFDVAGGVAVAANTTDVGTRNCPFKNGAAQTIRITPNIIPAANTGRVRVTISYYTITPPTS